VGSIVNGTQPCEIFCFRFCKYFLVPCWMQLAIWAAGFGVSLDLYIVKGVPFFVVQGGLKEGLQGLPEPLPKAAMKEELLPPNGAPKDELLVCSAIKEEPPAAAPKVEVPAAGNSIESAVPAAGLVKQEPPVAEARKEDLQLVDALEKLQAIDALKEEPLAMPEALDDGMGGRLDSGKHSSSSGIVGGDLGILDPVYVDDVPERVSAWLVLGMSAGQNTPR
jgi:hypothetical protein